MWIEAFSPLHFLSMTELNDGRPAGTSSPSMEHQVKDREYDFFGQEKEGLLFFFSQPAQISTSCGLCVDGEDINTFASSLIQPLDTGEAVCISKDRVSFRNKQWLLRLQEFLPMATKQLNVPSSSHGKPKLQAVIFQRAGEEV